MKWWEDNFLLLNKWDVDNIFNISSQSCSSWPAFLYPMFVSSTTIPQTENKEILGIHFAVQVENLPFLSQHTHFYEILIIAIISSSLSGYQMLQ